MYICMYVYMYVCMYVCMYLYMYVCRPMFERIWEKGPIGSYSRHEI